jgi:hypothetical protein
VWFIEGDITDCFGSLDHSIMKSMLAEDIRDGRFLRLIEGLLRAGPPTTTRIMPRARPHSPVSPATTPPTRHNPESA